jgi:hypothetical protein
MKTKALILLGILIIAFASVVAPVIAASTTTITGNPTSVIAVSVTGGTVNLPLNPQSTQPITDSSQTLTVSANAIGWTVAVEDKLDKDPTNASSASKPNKGYMSQHNTTTGYATVSPLKLFALMNVTGETMTTGTTPATARLDASGVIETGTAVASGSTGLISFKQISNYVDQVLTGTGNDYQIIVTFTGTAA